MCFSIDMRVPFLLFDDNPILVHPALATEKQYTNIYTNYITAYADGEKRDVTSKFAWFALYRHPRRRNHQDIAVLTTTTTPSKAGRMTGTSCIGRLKPERTENSGFEAQIRAPGRGALQSRHGEGGPACVCVAVDNFRIIFIDLSTSLTDDRVFVYVSTVYRVVGQKVYF